MRTPGPTRAALRPLRRIGLTLGLAVGLAVLPMPVRAEQADDTLPSNPVAESPALDVESPEPPVPDAGNSEPPPGGPEPATSEPTETVPEPAPGDSAPTEPAPTEPTPTGPVPVPGPQPIRILPLGDSLTWGIGSSHRSGYRTTLRASLTAAGRTVDFVGSQRTGTGPDTDHEGHPGWRIDQIDAQLPRWIRAADPDVVLLDIGTNDYVQRHDPARAPARLARTVDRIHALAPHARIVLAKLLVIAGERRGAGVRELNAAIPRIAAARRGYVTVADMSRIPVANTGDGVHPTDLGYRQMAHQWLAALRTVLPGGRAWPRTADPFPLPSVVTTAARRGGTLSVAVRLTGRLTAVDLGGVTVRLRFRPAGSRTWTSFGTARTNAAGVAQFRRRTSAAGQVSAAVVSGRAAGRVGATVAVGR